MCMKLWKTGKIVGCSAVFLFRHYFRLCENKYFFLVLNSVDQSQFIPLLSLLFLLSFCQEYFSFFFQDSHESSLRIFAGKFNLGFIIWLTFEDNGVKEKWKWVAFPVYYMRFQELESSIGFSDALKFLSSLKQDVGFAKNPWNLGLCHFMAVNLSSQGTMSMAS